MIVFSKDSVKNAKRSVHNPETDTSYHATQSRLLGSLNHKPLAELQSLFPQILCSSPFSSETKRQFVQYKKYSIIEWMKNVFEKID